ncbi:MAG: hypothetical protein ABSG25_03380 [Bryobacteraceae bacterium]
MANLQKHKMDLMREWLEPEAYATPAQAPRSGGKIIASRKLRGSGTEPNAQKVEPALIREPKAAVRTQESHSQPGSPEHLRKLQRIPRLRAPFSPNPSKSGPIARAS